MRAIFTIGCVCFLAIGLWNHDWTTIILCVVGIAIWPLLAKDIYADYRHHRELERLWDDDDLANGA